MAVLIEKPEDHIKFQLGNLMFSNAVLSCENEKLRQELEELKAKPGRKTKTR